MDTVVVVTNSPVIQLGIGAAAGPTFAVELCRSADIDLLSTRIRAPIALVVIDDTTGTVDAACACAAVARQSPGTPVLVFGNPTDMRKVRAAIEAGARGFLGNDAEPSELRTAISWLSQGQSVLDPRVTGDVLRWALQFDDQANGIGLSSQELEVLRIVSDGEPNKRIARTLGVSENTVKSYLRRAYKKLGCHTRSAAVTEAVKRGLI